MLVRPNFETAGDLADRTRVLVDTTDSGTSGDPTASEDLSLTAVMQVHPPVVEGKEAGASHLSYDPETERLHVGYKLAGDRFGGGVDILRAWSKGPASGLLSGCGAFGVTTWTSSRCGTIPARTRCLWPGR